MALFGSSASSGLAAPTAPLPGWLGPLCVLGLLMPSPASAEPVTITVAGLIAAIPYALVIVGIGVGIWFIIYSLSGGGSSPPPPQPSPPQPLTGEVTCVQARNEVQRVAQLLAAAKTARNQTASVLDAALAADRRAVIAVGIALAATIALSWNFIALAVAAVALATATALAKNARAALDQARRDADAADRYVDRMQQALDNAEAVERRACSTGP
jgi:hypothetical protein